MRDVACEQAKQLELVSRQKQIDLRLGLRSVEVSNASAGNDGVRYIANALPGTRLESLGIICDHVTSVWPLVKVLPSTNVRRLILSANSLRHNVAQMLSSAQRCRARAESKLG
jgi:hypothetical protein